MCLLRVPMPAHACPRPQAHAECPGMNGALGSPPGTQHHPALALTVAAATGPREQGYGKPLPAALTTNLKLL